MDRHLSLALTLGGLLLWGTVATADTDEISTRQTSLLAASCATCHGTQGRMSGAVPPLAGRSYDVLRQQLLAFQSGEASHATVMDRVVANYSEAELEAIARYFAAIE
ncbi:c-type cytochrome [Alkalilimnicola ehrlichii]|uniref:c-type cytochrome n=1 Tax=Alkalilimnicola ehrlichii TaxID=351052 RepID=UPI0011C0507A|nr:c-type cytochrome [Alkalilimnicola ehrlichii]